MARTIVLALIGLMAATVALAQQPPPVPPPVPPFLNPGLPPADPPPNPAAAAPGTTAAAPASPSKRARYSSDTAKRCKTKDSLICDLPITQQSGTPCGCRTSPGTLRPGTAIP